MTQPFTGPHGHKFDDVVDCLASFRKEPVVFVHNPGNAGDNLINLGTYRLFDNLGIQYVTGSHKEVYHDQIVIYSGGGALVPHYPGADIFFRRNHQVCKALVLLPHTVRMHGDIIREMDERCHLFAREEKTFEFMSQNITRANLYKAHDMAFLLDQEYINSLKWNFTELHRMGLLRAWVTMLVKFTTILKLKDSTLYSLRTDIESDMQHTSPLNYDMSQMFATGDMRRVTCENTAKALGKVLQSFESVKTDRLHIAIFSAILGINVEMYDNNYGKNQDIFLHSIKRFFRNVQLNDL